MALPDIRHAGVLADVTLFGWPYHGLCSGGSVTLPGGLTHAMLQPTHGAAWLYDRGLPPIYRSPDQATADALLGHQWFNYGFISGGVLYGTDLGTNRFIYIDPDGVRWLLTMTPSTPEISSQRVRLSFTVEKFGVLRENGASSTIAVNVLNVQCTSISIASFAGVNYSATAIYLEDVWTNGTKALVGVYRTDGHSADMFALIELEMSGLGGVYGEGVVISATEIRANTDLTYANAIAVAFDPGVSGSFPMNDTGAGCSRVITWGAFTGIFWETNFLHMVGTLDAADTVRDSTTSFARTPHYDDSGNPHVYRLVSGYKQDYALTGHSDSSSGSQTYSGTYCDVRESDAVCSGSTSISMSFEYGLTLLRDNVEIDSVKFVQTAVGVQYYATLRDYDSATYTGADPPAEPPTPPGWLSDPWGNRGGGYTKQVALFSAPSMSGSLASSLSISPPAFTGGQSFSASAPPLSGTGAAAIYSAWRTGTRYLSSGSAVIGGSDTVGIQRIDACAVGFYHLVSGTRTYGNIHTPLGALSAGMTSSGNIYFTWNRKTGAYSFSASPICYV